MKSIGTNKSAYFVPVFNQVRELPLVLDEIRAADVPCDTFIFVNDGSTDGSEQVLADYGYTWLTNEKRMGLGYCYMKALDWALEHGYSFFGTMAANGKMLPSEMPRLLGPVMRGEVDYATGSRFLQGGASPNLPAFRRTMIPFVNHYVRFLTGARLTDATCGYRAFSLDIIRKANFDWHKPWMYAYGFESYLYAKVLLSKTIRWHEVPITMRYPQKGAPYSKIVPFKGWYDMLKPWLIARLDGYSLDERVG